MILLTACATGSQGVNHAFAFDARIDSPDIEILNYRYGSTGSVGTNGDTSIRQFGRSAQAGSFSGPVPVGDTLYVKWRIRSTGQEFEDTVDLKSRLPRNMVRQEIYFLVKSGLLFVFLTDLTKPRYKEIPIVGPFKTQSYVTRQIYPDSIVK